MKEKHEPREERSTTAHMDHADALTTSLTDLIDEMDRAAFRRSLAGRDITRSVLINSHNLQPQPKR